jgi:hypothetical protein
MFKVMRKRCNECLYGKNKIVDNERRAEILREIDRKDNYFVCHKATIAGQEICCRGDFDRRGGGQLGRIAGRLGVIQFVDEPKPRTKPKPQPSSGGTGGGSG